jgi:WD40 repeat protein
VIIWDVAGRRQSGPALVGHADQVLCVAFSPDGKLLASGGMDGSIILWDVSSRKQVGQAIYVSQEIRTTSARAWITTLAFSPDGSLLAIGSKDGKIYFWDVLKSRLSQNALVGHRKEVTKVSFSPDGKMLASSSFDGTAIIWELASGRPRSAPLVADKSGAPLYDVLFSPNGKMFATSSMNGDIALWDVGSLQRIGNGFLGLGSSISFSKDGNALVAAGGQRVYFVPNPRAVQCSQLSPGCNSFQDPDEEGVAGDSAG